MNGKTLDEVMGGADPRDLSTEFRRGGRCMKSDRLARNDTEPARIAFNEEGRFFGGSQMIEAGHIDGGEDRDAHK